MRTIEAIIRFTWLIALAAHMTEKAVVWSDNGWSEGSNHTFGFVLDLERGVQAWKHDFEIVVGSKSPPSVQTF